MILAVTTALAIFPTLQESSSGPYTLFRPVPRDEMRDIVADRPDTTEAPITVDAGHYQFEISLADWTRDLRDDVFLALQSNIKIGLTESTDVQFVFDAYATEDNADGVNEKGLGDLQVRLKWNLWGNDGEDTAFALFPYVKFPTGTNVSNDELEGGLILPFSTPLSDSVDLGLMAQFGAVYDEVEDDHEIDFLHSAALGFPIVGATSSFVEYVGIVTEDDYLASFNVGVTHLATRDLILDAGVRLGLTGAADDVGVFVGFTARY